MLNFKVLAYVLALFLVVLSFIVKDAGATCTYTINGPTTLIKGSGADVSFEVTTQSGCSWLARNILNWSIATGTGSGTFIYHVPENKGSSPSGGIMQVTDNNSGANFTYYQAGCADVTINPATMSFGPDGGTGTVDWTVTSTVQGCDLSAFFPWAYADFFTYDPTEYKSGKITLSVYPYTVASTRTGGLRLPGYGDGEGEVPTALSPKLTISQTGSPSAKDDCAATLSSSLLLHSPIIVWNEDADHNPATYGGNLYYFSADFQYDPSFPLTDYVFNFQNVTILGTATYGGNPFFETTYTGWTGYKNYVCQQSYFWLDANNNFKLHIYEIILNNASYWLEFTYLPTTDGKSRFKLSDFGLNH